MVARRDPGEYLAMPDNGLGGKGNSAEFLFMAYFVAPDFKTAKSARVRSRCATS